MGESAMNSGCQAVESIRSLRSSGKIIVDRLPEETVIYSMLANS